MVTSVNPTRCETEPRGLGWGVVILNTSSFFVSTFKLEDTLSQLVNEMLAISAKALVIFKYFFFHKS